MGVNAESMLRHHKTALQMVPHGCSAHFTNPNWWKVWWPLTEAMRECLLALRAGGGIVVHCNAGRHRAPQICASVLMGVQQIGYDEAVTWPIGHCAILCVVIV